MTRHEVAKQPEVKSVPNPDLTAQRSKAPSQHPGTVRAPQAEEPTGYLTDETLEHLRRHYRGWDFHSLHGEFRSWLRKNPNGFPARYQSAFIGFVKQYHEKNRSQL